MSTQADEVDDLIMARMHEHHITGLSLAIVQDGKIVKAKGYGFTDESGKTPVTPATLFQAGSVSKPVAAAAALHMVQDGKLSLDTDVNAQLRTWKLPENEFTTDKKVTLREILCHSAGLTVHGFPGYDRNASIPSLVQVLDGIKPANTSAIRVAAIPGKKFIYSGGGYTVMQEMMIDSAGKPFPEIMRESVLKPFGMTNSTFEQPLPQDMAAASATGYYASGKEVRGQYHVYPEMAAAGLWTTASDLARFVMGIQQAWSGNSNSVLSQSTARDMLTDQYPLLSKHGGLGIFIGGSEKALQFWHNGRDAGFDAFIIGYANTGNGAAVLINSNDDKGTIREIIETVAKEYAWEGLDPNAE